MDPNIALAKARAALARIDGALGGPNDYDRLQMATADLADAFEDLDGWLKIGGFLPAEWAYKRLGCGR